MATTRLPNYSGRAWAITIDLHGKPSTVHHFNDTDLRDGWVAMDQEIRLAVEPSHPAVRRWLNQGQPSFWRRFLNLFR